MIARITRVIAWHLRSPLARAIDEAEQRRRGDAAGLRYRASVLHHIDSRNRSERFVSILGVLGSAVRRRRTVGAEMEIPLGRRRIGMPDA